jgi:tRNA-splicing ligase RtcB
MPISMRLNKGRVPVKVWTPDLDHDAMAQLIAVSQLPIVRHHVAAMPDVHVGVGATVGSVIPTAGAIIPAAVGVDIGCGMHAVQLSLNANDLPDGLAQVRADIEAAVPIGVAQHKRSVMKGKVLAPAARSLGDRLEPLLARHPEFAKLQRRVHETWTCQLGTLGGGNHFIEVCLDEARRVWVMLHSGSRGIGNAIGRHFIAAARKDMRRHQVNLPDRDLAYISEGSSLFDDYVLALGWAQDYAALNRARMLAQVLDALRLRLPPFAVLGAAIDCHHNYVAKEVHFGEPLYVTRKGAIRAGAGELGIVPGSMGAKSYIVRGLGSAQSFESCSHGAGRRMSRSEARRRYERRDLVAQTQGIECRKDGGVLDELPAAYKDIDEVMAHQHDLVEVQHTLRQVLCVKG